jgi:hypothetical protein
VLFRLRENATRPWRQFANDPFAQLIGIWRYVDHGVGVGDATPEEVFRQAVRPFSPNEDEGIVPVPRFDRSIVSYRLAQIVDQDIIVREELIPPVFVWLLI